MQKILCIVTASFLAITLQAQYKVTGSISDNVGNTLPDVHIQFNKKEFFSDALGMFETQSYPQGSYMLSFELEGFGKLDTLIQLNQNLNLAIRLQPQVTYLKEAKIEHSLSNKEKTIASHELNQKTLENYSGKTLGEALTEIEGVSMLKTGNSIIKPVINGLHSSRVPILSGTIRLEDQEWGSEHAPNIDVNVASTIRVIKGANALQYGGDAVGGLVIIEPESVARKDTLYGNALLALNSNGRGASLSTSISKGTQKGWFWNAVLTGKYAGDLESPDYNLSNTGNREENTFLQAGFKSTNFGIWGSYSLFNAQTGILKASHIGNLTDLVNAINNHEPYLVEDFTYEIDHPKQKVSHHLAQINAFFKLTDWGKINLQYAFQFNNRKEFDIRRGNYVNTPALDLDLTTHTARLDFESTRLGGWQLKSGLNGLFQINEPNPLTNVRPLIPDYQRSDLGAYFVSEFSPNPRWKFNAGIRYDFSHLDAKKYYLKSRWEERKYDVLFPEFFVGEFGNQILANPVYDFHNYAASLGVNFHPRHDYDFYLNASYVMRNPNPSELFSDGLHHSIGTIELGDLRLNQEKSVKISFTANHDSENLKWDISPYINFLQDFIQLIPQGLEYTVRGAFPVWAYAQNNALIAGIDASAQWNYSTNFSHHLTAAYLYGQNLEKHEPLVDMPPFSFSNSLTYKNENWQHLELTLKNQTFLKQNRFPDYNFSANLNVNGQITPTYVDISTPPNGYTLFDFMAQIQVGNWLDWKTTKLSLGLSVENLLNQKYRSYLNHQRFYADEMGRNFMIKIKINY